MDRQNPESRIPNPESGEEADPRSPIPDPRESIAVLARTNFYLTSIAEALDRAEIPYQLITPYDCWKSIAVKRLLDLLRLSVNPYDDLACRNLLHWPVEIVDEIGEQTLILNQTRVGESLFQGVYDLYRDPDLQEGISSFNIEALAILTSLFKDLEHAAMMGFSIHDCLERIWEEKWLPYLDENDIRHLHEWTASIDFEGSIPEFLRWVATRRVEDSIKENDDKIKLMTAHSAKGLEFDMVIVTGAVEGMFPMTKKDSVLEEERRLFYVACTRAKQRLVVTFPAQIRYRKKAKAQITSRFLTEAKINA